MPSIGVIINKLICAENSFCALCFKINQNIVLHDEMNIQIDETEQTLGLSDILLSVLGNEVKEYLSYFVNICENCLNFVTDIYAFIQMCHSNARALTKALDTLNFTLNCSNIKNEENKPLFVSINQKNFTTELKYDDTKLDSTTMALKHYISLNTPKIEDVSIIKKSVKAKKNEVRIQTTDILYYPNEELPRCKECLNTYPSLSSLKTHFLRVHAPKDQKCTKCLKSYSMTSLLSCHMSIDHCKMICSKCDKVFTSKSSFTRHESLHHLQLVCPICGRIYKNNKTYKKHIELNVCKQECRASPANARYTCDHCGKKYTQKMSLRVHIQYNHGNYKAHVCKWCGKNFWAQSRLKAHIVKHTKEKNFACSICQGKFVTKESLLSHTRLHTGEKPYKCSQCKCTFISSSRRAYHVKAYHLKPMVECQVCHSKFTSRSYLDKHKKSLKECQIDQDDNDRKTRTRNPNNNKKEIETADKTVSSKHGARQIGINRGSLYSIASVRRHAHTTISSP